MGLMGLNKGKRAEREVVKLLQPVLDEEFAMVGLQPIVLQRNLMQVYKKRFGTRTGSHDLIGVDWLALEVKHHEQFQLERWWTQTLEQAGELQEPVLFYRRNNVEWRVRMFGYVLSSSFRVKMPVDLDLDNFLVYFRMRVREQLQGSALSPSPT